VEECGPCPFLYIYIYIYIYDIYVPLFWRNMSQGTIVFYPEDGGIKFFETIIYYGENEVN
jgi:hypothetical protein